MADRLTRQRQRRQYQQRSIKKFQKGEEPNIPIRNNNEEEHISKDELRVSPSN